MADSLQLWLTEHNFAAPNRTETVAGGSINRTSRLHFADGNSLFLKQNDRAPRGMFPAEAAGLATLAATDALIVPRVIAVTEEWLLLEDLGAGKVSTDYWPALGQGLALLHGNPQPRFGFPDNNYCGSTVQINTQSDDGFEFFALNRLLIPGREALQRGLLTNDDFSALEFVANHLHNWIPQQPPVLIHGDLWSGNIHSTSWGLPALIDPACYWGWAEAELAMTVLFGGFDSTFYASYQQHSAIGSHWRERAPLYNLYHLLNHLLLFGGSYSAQVRAITRRYAA